MKIKLEPHRVLFTLRMCNAIPPDFELLLFGDTREWLEAVTDQLLGEMNRHSPHLFDKLRT